MIKDNLLL